jgi:hypothetical protein
MPRLDKTSILFGGCQQDSRRISDELLATSVFIRILWSEASPLSLSEILFSFCKRLNRWAPIITTASTTVEISAGPKHDSKLFPLLVLGLARRMEISSSINHWLVTRMAGWGGKSMGLRRLTHGATRNAHPVCLIILVNTVSAHAN